MKKRRLIILLIVALLLVTSAIAAVALSSPGSVSEILYQAGLIDRELLNSGTKSFESDAIMAKGEHISISRLEAETIAQKHALTGSGGLDEAVEYLVQRETLYYHAQQSGLDASEQEVRDLIDVQKKSSKEAVNYSDFEQYLNGLGMTADEYWDSQFENLKKGLVISKYLDHEYSIFAQSNGLGDIDISSSEGHALRNSFKEDLSKKIIKAENIKYIDETD